MFVHNKMLQEKQARSTNWQDFLHTRYHWQQIFLFNCETEKSFRRHEGINDFDNNKILKMRVVRIIEAYRHYVDE